MAFNAIYGDSHNFGCRVSVTQTCSGELVVMKPRTTYWEYLFLDYRSPLRMRLRDLSCAFSFDDLLGNIRVEQIDGHFTGKVEFYKEPSVGKIAIQSTWFRNYGRILAFCSIFGITDLHIDNALISKHGIQLVDIESVFWNTLVPSETLLLPKTPDHILRNVLSKVGLLGLRSFTSDLIADILLGAIEMFAVFLNSRGIVEKINDLSNEFGRHPIRFLIRDTRDYNKSLSFYPEEKIQLARKDIPYFFGFYKNEGEIWYYDTKGSSAIFSNADEDLHRKIAKSFQAIDILLHPARLAKLENNLIAEVLDKLWVDHQNLIEEKDMVIHRDSDFTFVKTQRREFKVRNRP